MPSEGYPAQEAAFPGPPGGRGGPPGGGFGGPPPGGFGGPPQGPPGGFGGPPPGGFGGPPQGPPGGFGGPPQGPPGGFGGPPQGGYGGQPPGPPGGFGGGYRQAPPPKKGSNVPLIVGLGCGGLLLLVIIVGVVASFVIDSSKPSSVDDDSVAAAEDDDAKKPTPEAPPVAPPSRGGSVDLVGERLFNARSGKTVYVVAELQNKGTTAIASPRAKITLLDSKKNSVGEGTCSAWGVRDLRANEKVPCFTSITRSANYKTYRVKVEHSKVLSNTVPLSLKPSKIDSVAASNKYSPHKVSGTITNHSSSTSKTVVVMIGLYDANDKIVGAGHGLPTSKIIPPGGTTRFKATLVNVGGKPVRSLTQVYAYTR